MSDAHRAALIAYRSGIMRYRKLLETNLTAVERMYIKKRIAACETAIATLTELDVGQPLRPPKAQQISGS